MVVGGCVFAYLLLLLYSAQGSDIHTERDRQLEYSSVRDKKVLCSFQMKDPEASHAAVLGLSRYVTRWCSFTVPLLLFTICNIVL